MTGASPSGSTGGDRDERDRARYAPRPPSERGADDRQRPDGVGLFRLAGWGWPVTIALGLLVGVVIVVGYLRNDPGRNPAPAAYRVAVCAAAAELSAGTDALEGGVAERDDRELRESARDRVLAHVAAASAALADLPEWIPGRPLDELLGAQIISLTNGAGALESGPADSDLDVARGTDGEITGHLSSERFGFTCG